MASITDIRPFRRETAKSDQLHAINAIGRGYGCGASANQNRVFRPGRKLCVVTANVSQMTNHGLLKFPRSIFSKDGTGGRWGSASGQRPIFDSYPISPKSLFKNVHEYVIVFAKLGLARSKGANDRQYYEIMSPSPMLQPAE